MKMKIGIILAGLLSVVGSALAGFNADFDLDFFYEVASGVDQFDAGVYAGEVEWRLGLENEEGASVDVGTVAFKATYPLEDLWPEPDRVEGTHYFWDNMMIPAHGWLDFEGTKGGVKETRNIPVTIVRDWSPKIITESTNVTVTVTVTPTIAWAGGGVEVCLYSLFHNGEVDWWNSTSFASLSYVGETHPADWDFDFDFNSSSEQAVEWDSMGWAAGVPQTFTLTVHYELHDGSGPVAIEPEVWVGGVPGALKTEDWLAGTLGLEANGSVSLDVQPTDSDLAWGDFMGIGFHSSAVAGSAPISLSNHVEEIEIGVGYALEEGQYVIEFELEATEWDSIASVSVAAPFGSFECEQDWSNWDYEHAVPASGTLPDVDGDWIVSVAFTNGSVGTTTIPFARADGTTPIPNVTTCPALTSPVLPAPGGWMFATNGIMLEWDAAFDPHANAAGSEWENSVDDYEFFEFLGTLPSSRTYGPVDIEAGMENIWIYNGYGHSGENDDGIEFNVYKFAYHGYDVDVVGREWDADQDQISNEWEYRYSGSLTNYSATADSDGDGVNNLDEFRAGTNPTDAASRFVVSSDPQTSGAGFKVEWTPVANREYAVYWSTNLTAGFERIASKLKAPQSSYVDVAHAGQAHGCYRVEVGRVNTNADAVQNMEIQVDGNTADWNGQQPQFVDPVGDSSIYSGLDITGITLAKGSSDLFVKVDRAGTTRPAGKYSNIWIHLKADGENTDYSIELFHDGTSSRDARLFDSSSRDHASYIMLSDSLSFNDSGSSIEIAIPLSKLSLVDHYAVSCYTHSMENGEWTNNGEEEDNWAIIVMPY